MGSGNEAAKLKCLKCANECGRGVVRDEKVKISILAVGGMTIAPRGSGGCRSQVHPRSVGPLVVSLALKALIHRVTISGP